MAVDRELIAARLSAFDIGTHCISGLGLARPDRYADILPTLSTAGVVSPDTARELESLAGFRNLLGHGYIRIDHARVQRIIGERLEGLRRFAAEVAGWMTGGKA